MGKVYIMRHADPVIPGGAVYGKEFFYVGCNSDWPLCENGIERARSMIDEIATLGITHLYTSPLKRSMQTAEILNEKLGLTLHLDARICETDCGEWDGRSHQEIADLYPELLAEMQKDRMAFQFPGGETFGNMGRRGYEFIQELYASLKPEDTALVVAHSGWSLALLIHSGKLALEAFDLFRLSYCGYYDFGAFVQPKFPRLDAPNYYSRPSDFIS